MAGDVEIRVIGLPEAIAKLDPANIGHGWERGMMVVGMKLRDGIRVYLKPHHLTGRAEQQIHTEKRGSGLNTAVFVGASTALVPELRPLVLGWHSASGKQPPVEAIAAWLAHKPEAAGSSSVFRSSKGFVRRSGTISQVSAEASIRARAFVIARAIGRRGYSFGKTDAFNRGYALVAPQIPAILEKSIRDTL